MHILHFVVSRCFAFISGYVAYPFLATIITVAAIITLPGTVQAQQDEWQRIGPDGASLYRFTRAGTDLYAGGRGCVYRSTDGGYSWENCGLSTVDEVTNLVWHEASTTLFVIAGTTIHKRQHESEWTFAAELPYNIAAGDRRRPTALLSMDNAVYATSGDGVYRSIDNGASWTPVLLSAGMINAICTTSSGAMVASGSSMAYRSTNGGISWDSTDISFINGMKHLAVRGTTIYGATNSTTLLKSTDDGIHWTTIELSRACDLIAADDEGVYTYCSECPAPPSLLASSDGVIWRNVPLPDIIQGLYTDRDGIRVASNTSVYGSTDHGATWTLHNEGLYTLNVLALARQGHTLYCTSGTNVYRSTDLGRTWSAPIDVGSSQILVTLYTNDTLVIAMSGWAMHISTDGGSTWASHANVLFTKIWNPAVAVHKGTLVVGSYGGHILLSADMGATWTNIDNRVDITETRDVIAVLSDGEYLHAALVGGYMRSNDGGSTWKAHLNSSEGSFPWMTPWIYRHDERLMAYTQNRMIHLSTDDGVTWRMGSDPMDGSVAAFTGRGDDLFFAMVDGRIVHIVDTKEGEQGRKTDIAGPEGAIPQDIELVDDMLFMATYSQGVFRRRYITTSVEHALGDLQQPSSMPLHIYPLPSTDLVVVEGLSSADVTLYGIDGTVAFLTGEYGNAGLRLDVSGLVPGMWTIRGTGIDGREKVGSIVVQ